MRRFGIVLLLLLMAAHAHAQLGKGDVPFDDLGFDRDGNPVIVSGLRGKVVVISFWASWCGYCLKELPVLESVQRLAGTEQLVVVAVNYKEERRHYLAMLRRLKDAQMTMTHDRTGKLAAPYAIKGLPFLVMIDRGGRIAYVHRGYSEDMLDDIVDQLNGLLQESPAS